MIKIKKFSVYNDFKTGILYKILLLIGFVLLFLYIMEFLILKTNFSDILISSSILFISFGLITYFFHIQFNKLANIANEIENEDEIEKK